MTSLAKWMEGKNIDNDVEVDGISQEFTSHLLLDGGGQWSYCTQNYSLDLSHDVFACKAGGTVTVILHPDTHLCTHEQVQDTAKLWDQLPDNTKAVISSLLAVSQSSRGQTGTCRHLKSKLGQWLMSQ